MRIERIIIKDLFGYKSFDWRLNDINILVGKNGSGKTNLLQIINSIMLLNMDNIDFIQNKNNKIKSFQKDKYLDKKDKYLEFLERVKSLDVIFSNEKKISFKSFDIFDAIEKHISNSQKNNNSKLPPEILQSVRKLQKISVEKPRATSVSSNLSKNTPRTRLIHTTRALANSSSTFFSNGDEGSVIDLEIRNGLTELFSYKEKAGETFAQAKETLTENINILLNESGKVVELIEQSIIIKEKGKKINFKNLSSGECVIIYSFLMAALSSFNDDIILMDEPEISLHLSWQKKFINCIRSISPRSQLIIVTHSPGIAMNGFLDKMIDIYDIETHRDEQ